MVGWLDWAGDVGALHWSLSYEPPFSQSSYTNLPHLYQSGTWSQSRPTYSTSNEHTVDFISHWLDKFSPECYKRHFLTIAKYLYTPMDHFPLLSNPVFVEKVQLRKVCTYIPQSTVQRCLVPGILRIERMDKCYKAMCRQWTCLGIEAESHPHYCIKNSSKSQ